MLYLTINRKGEFTSKAKDKNQCRAVGHSKYYYQVAVECLPRLNEVGFLLDHLEIDEVMQVFSQLDPLGSCEQIVLAAINGLERHLKARNIEWVSIKVAIRPTLKPVAWIEGHKTS